MIKYSIIIPFHSNLNLLTICVNALYKVLDFSESELIIVDNNVDGSQIDSNIETDKHCTIISKKENLMYPRAINMGAANARGDYLIFCDADTCVSKDFHKLLVKELETDGIGYASAKLVNMYTNNLQEFGITSSYYNFPHPFYGRPINFKLIQNNHYPMAACAACSAIKRELFYDIGGFDEKRHSTLCLYGIHLWCFYTPYYCHNKKNGYNCYKYIAECRWILIKQYS